MKMKSQYVGKTLQMEGRQAGRGQGLDTKTAVLSQSILYVTGEFV